MLCGESVLMTDQTFHNQVKEIFSEALEMDEAQRLQYLDKVCGDDKDLRSEVESLLASFEKSEEFIETPAFSVNQITSPPTHFGNYKIIKEIGQGGMGTVYLAERSDGQFEQMVAIKIVRQIFADSEIIRRFKNERQILAKLQHQNIASLLDGGITESGQPFLAMEYIDGENIADFCKQISIKERLKLFLKVCKGVSYAHRNLVIHRDIKPSNIIVNRENEPKLLDFGLAKLSEKNSDATQSGLRALTPAYASPEQLKGETITTASDIYSLGVVLYEILTETRPFETDGKSFDEIVRTVTVIEPVLPSKNPQSAFRNPQLLSGDIDNIVAYSLRKEPSRRYESVDQFAKDIENYLDGLPVIARPNTLVYRTEKFFKRNKVAVVAALLILLSLIGGLIISLRQTSIAYAQEKKAVTESEKSQKITKFMEKVLNYANPAWYAEGSKLNGQAKLIEVLDDLSDKIGTEFPDDLEIQAELHHKSAEIYNAKANRTKALFHAETALKIRRSVFGEKNAEVAKDMYYLASVYQTLKKYNQMKKLYEESAAIFRAVDSDNPNLPYLLDDLGQNYKDIWKDYDQAERNLTEALEIFRKKDGEIHYNTARLYLELAENSARKGETIKADEYFFQGEKRFKQLTDENLRNAFVLFHAQFEQAKGNSNDAETILENFIAQSSGNKESDFSKSLPLFLKEIYWQNKKYQKLADFEIKELEIAKTTLPRNEIGIGSMNLEIALTFYRFEKNDVAKKYFDEGFPIYKTLLADSTSKIGFDQNVAECLFHQKRYAEAKPILQNVVAFYAENNPPNHEDTQMFRDLLEKTELNLMK